MKCIFLNGYIIIYSATYTGTQKTGGPLEFLIGTPRRTPLTLCPLTRQLMLMGGRRERPIWNVVVYWKRTIGMGLPDSGIRKGCMASMASSMTRATATNHPFVASFLPPPRPCPALSSAGARVDCRPQPDSEVNRTSAPHVLLTRVRPYHARPYRHRADEGILAPNQSLSKQAVILFVPLLLLPCRADPRPTFFFFFSVLAVILSAT